MARGQVVIDGGTWEVFPSGGVTVYGRDQFGIVFQQGTGPERRRRFTRFAPGGSARRAVRARPGPAVPPVAAGVDGAGECLRRTLICTVIPRRRTASTLRPRWRSGPTSLASPPSP